MAIGIIILELASWNNASTDLHCSSYPVEFNWWDNLVNEPSTLVRYNHKISSRNTRFHHGKRLISLNGLRSGIGKLKNKI